MLLYLFNGLHIWYIYIYIKVVTMSILNNQSWKADRRWFSRF